MNAATTICLCRNRARKTFRTRLLDVFWQLGFNMFLRQLLERDRVNTVRKLALVKPKS